MKDFQTSISYFNEGKFEEALSLINGCIEKEKNLEYYFFRARVQSRLGDFSASLKDFDHLVKIEPFNPTYINDRAVVLHLMKDNKAAFEEFDRAINLDPNNPYRYASRAYFRDRIGDLLGAIEDYEKAIELDPEDAVAYNNKGLLEEKLGYQARSKKSFLKADDLTGRPVDSQLDASPVIEKHAISSDQTAKSVTFKGYFDIVKNIFLDSNTRKDFFGFLKSKVSK